MIEIKRCGSQNVASLMKFIDQHWRKDHVLGTSRRLMDWQHQDSDGRYNYILAWRGDDLLGALGFIPSRRYDAALTEDNLLWLALWKIRDDCKVAGLGLQMLQVLCKVEPHVAMGVNGINLDHPPMYRSLGYQVFDLKQYFVVNPDSSGALISTTSNNIELPHPAAGDAIFNELTADQLLATCLEPSVHVVPHKTPEYFVNRFLRHPFYCYRVFLITSNSKNSALIATRSVQHQGFVALRIVDFFGNPEVWAQCGAALYRLMRDEGAQYADFWQYGISHDVLAAAGFETVRPSGPVVVPNYFEPFLAQNGRIICAVKSVPGEPIVVCRADGDQDRPNYLHRPELTPCQK